MAPGCGSRENESESWLASDEDGLASSASRPRTRAQPARSRGCSRRASSTSAPRLARTRARERVGLAPTPPHSSNPPSTTPQRQQAPGGHLATRCRRPWPRSTHPSRHQAPFRRRLPLLPPRPTTTRLRLPPASTPSSPTSASASTSRPSTRCSTPSSPTRLSSSTRTSSPPSSASATSSVRLALPLPARALLVKGADVHSRPPADQSRYLFSRLLLRKPTWIRLSSLLASSSYSTDISDLPAACAELWRIAEPVAGPSTPPKREQVAALVEPKKEDSREGFLDLTLTDSDDDVPPPVSVKGKKPGVNKGKARATPRTLISDVPESLDLGDLSRFAFDQAVLIDEPPEHTLALLSMDELTALGKRMKVPCKSGASVRPPLPPSPQEHVLVRLGLTPCLSLSLSLRSAASGPRRSSRRRTSPPCRSSSPHRRRPRSSRPLARPTWSASRRSVRSASATTPRATSCRSRASSLPRPSSSSVRPSLLALGPSPPRAHGVALPAGPVIRLSPALFTLFNRLSLVYHRTSYTAGTSSTSASPLTASLLARFGKRAYPTYTVSRSFALFPSRAVLREFEAAMAVEQRVEAALDGVWGPGVPKRAERETKEERLARYGEGVRAWEEIEGEWARLCGEAEDEARRVKKEEDEAVAAAAASGEGEGEGKGQRGAHGRLYYRRRFHPGWPLSRAAYKAAACYAKLVRPPLPLSGSLGRPLLTYVSPRSQGDHDSEVAILRHLLAQTSFRRGKRGDWYDRLALVLMKYPLGDEALLGDEVKGKKRERKDRLLRERRDEALRVCEEGLKDPFTHLSASLSPSLPLLNLLDAWTDEALAPLQSTSRPSSAASPASSRPSKSRPTSAARSTSSSPRRRRASWRASASIRRRSARRACGARATAQRSASRSCVSSSTCGRAGRGASRFRSASRPNTRSSADDRLVLQLPLGERRPHHDRASLPHPPSRSPSSWTDALAAPCSSPSRSGTSSSRPSTASSRPPSRPPLSTSRPTPSPSVRRRPARPHCLLFLLLALTDALRRTQYVVPPSTPASPRSPPARRPPSSARPTGASDLAARSPSAPTGSATRARISRRLRSASAGRRWRPSSRSSSRSTGTGPVASPTSGASLSLSLHLPRHLDDCAHADARPSCSSCAAYGTRRPAAPSSPRSRVRATSSPRRRRSGSTSSSAPALESR